MPACRSPIGSICRASGLTIRPVAKRRVPQRRSGSRPSQIALEQIRAALLAGGLPGANGCELRQQQQPAPGPTGLGTGYVAAIQPTTKVRPVREDDPEGRGFPPFRTPFRRSDRKISPSQWLSTPRRPRSGRSATSPIRSPPSVASWPPRLQTDFTDARTVCAAFAAVRGGIMIQ
jgi:hypothetical protein